MVSTSTLSIVAATEKVYPDWRTRMAKNYAPPRRGRWGPMLPYTYTVPPTLLNAALPTP